MIRAKFRCNSVEHYGPTSPETARTFRFTPVTASEVPEDRRFSRYTPSGELVMRVDNPAVEFEVGGFYYVDFTPAG